MHESYGGILELNSTVYMCMVVFVALALKLFPLLTNSFTLRGNDMQMDGKGSSVADRFTKKPSACGVFCSAIIITGKV